MPEFWKLHLKSISDLLSILILNKFLRRGVSYFLDNSYTNKYFSGYHYWENRYVKNGNSGKGSYGLFAKYKANVLNKFVKDNNISKIVEFGCGDGNQLKQFQFPSYIGLDISPTAIRECLGFFKDDHTKSFFIYNHKAFYDNSNIFLSELAISLDVMYHLVEDEVYEKYLQDLFSSASRFVIIYAWDVEGKPRRHVRHRKFSAWIAENLREWNLTEVIHNAELEGACDFFIYQKNSPAQ
ncbi:MAG: class I SAM-dependent methyltransferase [Bacteroidota bacterium]|nr:class I SAM-dependent methyltransferase [Bacteroidota bacterium]